MVKTRRLFEEEPVHLAVAEAELAVHGEDHDLARLQHPLGGMSGSRSSVRSRESRTVCSRVFLLGIRLDLLRSSTTIS